MDRSDPFILLQGVGGKGREKKKEKKEKREGGGEKNLIARRAINFQHCRWLSYAIEDSRKASRDECVRVYVYTCVYMCVCVCHEERLLQSNGVVKLATAKLDGTHDQTVHCSFA